MKKILCLTLAAILLLSVTAFATTPRAITVVPDIEFDGTEAICVVRITADNLTDTIYATMTLKQGNTVIDSWSGIGEWSLKLKDTVTVELNKTYTLTVVYSVNGVVHTPITISRTNN